MKTFTQYLRIRMSHCDTAGFMFHPQYFVLLNGVMEDFFREHMDLTFGDCVRSGAGFPVVSLASDFPKITRLGELVRVEMSVEHLGRSSVSFAFEMFGEDGSLRLRAREVAVYVTQDKATREIESAPIPDVLKAKLAEYLRETPLTIGQKA